MPLLNLALSFAVAYGLYRYIHREPELHRVAFADGESTPSPVDVRNAGPESMRDPPEWDDVDEARDESFPARDPPATHRFD